MINMPKYGTYKPTKQETQYFSDLILSKLPAIFEGIARHTSKFDALDLQRYLKAQFDYTTSVASTSEAVWEIDDDHDGKISWEEFRTATIRCINDMHAREPQQVFNVVLFSVFAEGSGMLTEQSLKQLLFLRFGKASLGDRLEKGFGQRGAICSVGLDEFIRGMSLLINE